VESPCSLINYWPQWTHITLWAPTELTDWPLAPDSYVIVSLLIGLQHAVASYRTQHMQRNGHTAYDNRFYPCVHCIFRVCALRALEFFYLRCMTSMCCVHCVAYGSLETDLASVSKLPYATQSTQRMLVMRNRYIKPKRTHTKNTTHAQNRIDCMRCVFACMCCVFQLF